MNALRKFFFRLLCFLVVVIFLDFLIGQLFSYLLAKQNDGRFYKIQYSLKHSNEDIIIIGSSRAETNYNPAVFTEVLGLSCWNAGRGGQELVYFLAVEQEILKRYIPKVIIINIDPRSLEKPLDYDKYSILRPYTKEYSDIFNLLSRKDFKEKYKLRSSLYVYNSVLFYLIRPFFVKNKDGKNSDKGWKPKTGVISNSVVNERKSIESSKQKSNLNEEKVSILNKMIDLAKNYNCKLVFSISPDYLPSVIETATIFYLKKLSKDSSFQVLDFTQDTTLVGKQKFFYDLEHMNNVGATEFTKKLTKHFEKTHLAESNMLNTNKIN